MTEQQQQTDSEPRPAVEWVDSIEYDLMRQVIQDAQALFRTLDEPSWEEAMALLRRDTHRYERHVSHD